jgi:hypothetical protein
VTDWTIQVPHRDRDESLATVAGHARRLPGDDAAVTREIVLRAELAGHATAGDLIDALDRSTPDARRNLLDAARVAVGLRASRDVDAEERLRILQVPDAREFRLAYSESGAIIEVDPADQAGADAERERLARINEQRANERAAEVAEQDEQDAALRAQVERELPPHLRGQR